MPDFADTPAARNGNVFAVDATSFFSRPGPRIVDGLEILAWAVHPEAYPRAAARVDHPPEVSEPSTPPSEAQAPADAGA